MAGAVIRLLQAHYCQTMECLCSHAPLRLLIILTAFAGLTGRLQHAIVSNPVRPTTHLDFRRRGTHAYGQQREDLLEAFRRMVFAVLSRNCDDHPKNTSFVLRPGHGWRLAPAYDVTFAHNPQGEWTSQHLMAVNGRFTGITRDDLLAEAERFGLGEGRGIVGEVAAAVGRWPEFAAPAGVDAEEAARIGALHLRP